MVTGNGLATLGKAKAGTRKKKGVAKRTPDGEEEHNEEAAAEDIRSKFTKRDYDLLCEWLEVHENLASVGGTDGKTKVGGRYRNRKQGFEALGVFIMANQLRSKTTLRKVPGESARNRWSYLMQRYKKAKPEIESTGFGLSAEDEANGILTLEAKMESMCPCYERLDAIYGARPGHDFNTNMYSTPRAEGDAEHRPWDQSLPQSPNEDDDSENDNEEDQEAALDPSAELTHQDGPLPQGVGTNSEQPPPIQVSPVTNLNGHTPIPAEPATPQGNTTLAPGDGSMPSAQPSRVGASKATEKRDSINPSLYPGRKRALDKSQSLVGALAASMEAQAQGKGQSNDVKQKGLDLHFASLQQDRELREQTSMKERSIALKRLRLEEKKLQEDTALAKQKFEQEAEIARAKLKQEAESSKVQAIIQVINSNKERSPAEIAELLQFLDRAM